MTLAYANFFGSLCVKKRVEAALCFDSGGRMGTIGGRKDSRHCALNNSARGVVGFYFPNGIGSNPRPACGTRRMRKDGMTSMVIWKLLHVIPLLDW